jgi:hypothetical protein
MRQPSWVEDEQAISELSSGDRPPELAIGGRFICDRDEDEDRMTDSLAERVLLLSDRDQCEVVGAKVITANQEAIREAIENMRLVARELGYRLISVEAGDFEGGDARVLASENGYVPWWKAGK